MNLGATGSWANVNFDSWNASIESIGLILDQSASQGSPDRYGAKMRKNEC